MSGGLVTATIYPSPLACCAYGPWQDGPMTAPEGPFFFIHVMKTGGTTFISQIGANFPPEAVYPSADPEPMKRMAQYLFLQPLQALTPEQLIEIRLFHGHLPFMATTLVGPGVITLTIIRDPVARTLSHLRHIKRGAQVAGVLPTQRYREMTLEEIYDDPLRFNGFIHNFQSKLFAMSAEDGVTNCSDVLEVDDRRLELAKQNLESVDVLGLSERHGEFVAEMRRRFGWNIEDIPNQQVSGETWDVSPEFRNRIAHDNAADMDFYAFAVELYERRNPSSEPDLPALSTSPPIGRG